MRFSTRNAFYLRASNYRVIPLFLYLDERHVDWMSDDVLNQVIAELKPKMPDLLRNSRGNQKHKVYVERGEGYQYCYFLRTTTRTEVVLLKEKTYSLRPPTPPPPRVKSTTPDSRASPKRPKRTQRSSRARSRSLSARAESTPGLDEVDTVKMEPPSPRIGFEEEEDEEVNIKDWKPDVDVKFKGFGTSSVQLVLIIEPYPPLPSSQYAPPSSRLSTRSASIAASRSRSRQVGTGLPGSLPNRYSSVSLSVAPDPRAARPAPERNMRNPTRSVSATPIPNSRRGGSSTPYGTTPFGQEATGGPSTGTPGPSGDGPRGGTPLFIPRDTPFGEDDEDEEAHEEYTAALREGRLRLPSVSRPAGTPEKRDTGRRSVRRSVVDEDDELEDIPESLEAMSERLVRSSEIEEGITRVQGGWEEREEGEESAVMGKEEPGD